MRLFIFSLYSIVLSLSANSVLAQDDEQTLEDQAQAERIARIQELRQLEREERQARRQNIRRRLEGLTEDERRALRERRRIVEQARTRQGQRMRGPVRQGCPCPDDSESLNEQE